MMKLSSLLKLVTSIFRKKKMNLNATQASSQISGLLDIGSPPDVNTSVGGFTLPAPGNSATFTFNLPNARSDIISLTRINFIGVANANSGWWYPIPGSIFFSGFATGTTASVRVRTLPGGGRQVLLTIVNSTVGASVTVPGFNVNIHAHFYALPF